MNKEAGDLILLTSHDKKYIWVFSIRNREITKHTREECKSNEYLSQQLHEIDDYDMTAVIEDNKLNITGLLNATGTRIRWINNRDLKKIQNRIYNVNGNKLEINCNSIDNISNIIKKEIPSITPEPVFVNQDLRPVEPKRFKEISDLDKGKSEQKRIKPKEQEKVEPVQEKVEIKQENKEEIQKEKDLYTTILKVMQSYDTISVPMSYYKNLIVSIHKTLYMNMKCTKMNIISSVRLDRDDKKGLVAVINYDECAEYVRVTVLEPYDIIEIDRNKINALEVMYNKSKKENSFMTR
jgi:hypothetical protein